MKYRFINEFIIFPFLSRCLECYMPIGRWTTSQLMLLAIRVQVFPRISTSQQSGKEEINANLMKNMKLFRYIFVGQPRNLYATWDTYGFMKLLHEPTNDRFQENPLYQSHPVNQYIPLSDHQELKSCGNVFADSSSGTSDETSQGSLSGEETPPIIDILEIRNVVKNIVAELFNRENIIY